MRKDRVFIYNTGVSINDFLERFFTKLIKSAEEVKAQVTVFLGYVIMIIGVRLTNGSLSSVFTAGLCAVLLVTFLFLVLFFLLGIIL